MDWKNTSEVAPTSPPREEKKNNANRVRRFRIFLAFTSAPPSRRRSGTLERKAKYIISIYKPCISHLVVKNRLSRPSVFIPTRRPRARSNSLFLENEGTVLDQELNGIILGVHVRHFFFETVISHNGRRKHYSQVFG